MFATAVQAYEATQAAQLGLFAPAAAQVGEGGDQEHEVCSRITDETVHRLADLIKRRWPTPSAERIAARLLDLESTQVLSQWQEGGWELKGIYFPDRRRCFVSRNYPDKRWRIVADPRATSSGNEGATYPTRESAIRAARCLCATCWLDVLAGR